MSRTLLRRGLVSLVAMSLSLQAPLALAQNQTPNDLSDLVGARAAGAERDLESRGFVNHHGAKSGDASYTYWWSSTRKQCVRVRTADGRYDQVVQVSNSDCNQKDPDSGPSTGAKVAIGAAALLGVVALAHKSHHRDDRRYDERQSADFERGYRDALYNHPYHNYGNAREYNEGYTAGSDVLKMLYTEPNMASWAAEHPAEFPAGTNWEYLSAVSNILAQLVQAQFPTARVTGSIRARRSSSRWA